MTPRQQSWARTILVAVGSGLLLAVMTGAWRMKENVADHDRDIATLRQERASVIGELRTDIGQTRALMERMLDAQCEGRPSLRACR